MLYKTLVRPHLEYGNLVWGPFNRADEKLTERVQRRATKLIKSIRHLPYEDRLRHLKLPSLYYRRRRGDMIAVYKIMNGKLDVQSEKFFERAASNVTRGHPLKLVKPTAQSRTRRRALASRVINDWNALPPSVVLSSSVNQFKSRLDDHWNQQKFTILD